MMGGFFIYTDHHFYLQFPLNRRLFQILPISAVLEFKYFVELKCKLFNMSPIFAK